MSISMHNIRMNPEKQQKKECYRGKRGSPQTSYGAVPRTYSGVLSAALVTA
jgi:hypothetical protein